MKPKLSFWLRLSRPRFWLYLTGPYLIGLTAAIINPSQWWSFKVWLWFAFFIFPANLYLYGINDLFDQDTDTVNIEKKGKQELKYTAHNDVYVQPVVVAIGLGFLFLGFFGLPLWSFLYLVAFLLLALTYSAQPIRFKSRPVLDFMSNVLYVMPAGVAWSLLTHKPLPWLPLLAGWLWCAAMHLFSAIPDIEADSQARLHTTAVVLGKQKSLILVSLLWLGSAVATYALLGSIGIVALVYPLIPLLLLTQTIAVIRRAYWYFPALNGLFGFGLFWWVLWR